MSIGKFNIVLVGNSKVGKTSFLQRNLTRDFNLSTRRAKRNLLGDFIPTTFHLTFETEQGVVEFEVIECDDSNLPLEFDASAAILMFDVTNKESYNHLGYWRDTVFDHFGELSTIVCGNKADVEPRVVTPKMIKFHRENGMLYFDVSAKSGLNIEEPFLCLANHLTKFF